MFSNNPFEQGPEDFNPGENDLAEVMKHVGQQLSNQLSLKKTQDVTSLSLEGQVLHFLVKHRTEELVERHSSESYLQLQAACFSNLANNVTDLLAKTEEEPPSEYSASLNISFKEEQPTHPDQARIKEAMGQFSTMPEMTRLRAEMAACIEFKTSEQRAIVNQIFEKKKLSASAEVEKPDAIPQVSSIDKAAEKLERFHWALTDKIVELAKEIGVLGATEPAKRHEIIRSMITRDEYLEMKTAVLGQLSRVVDSFAKLDFVSKVMESMNNPDSFRKVFAGNGQLERLEVLALYDIMADVRAIWGQD